MVDVVRPPRAASRTFIRAAVPVVLLAAGALGLCQLKSGGPALSRQSLYIDTVRSGPLSVEVRAAGTLVPESVEWVPAGTAGRVERVVVTPGSAVAAGDLLIQLSNPQIVQAAQEAELHVRAAEAELRSRRLQLASAVLQQEAVVAAARVESTEAGDRARADNELAAAGLTSALTLKASQGKAEQLGVRADVEQKRLDLLRRSEVTDLSAEESRLEQLRALAGLRRQELDALHIRAGRAGIVQQVAVEAGQRVAAGTNLARVAAPEPLKAVLQISQLEAAAVVPGQRVQVDLHGGVVEGTVSRIDPAVQNGSVAVDVRLPRELPPAARPDLSVDAAIEIERAPRALQTGRPVHVRANTEVALFRLSADGTGAVRVPVRIGRTSFNRIEILSGLRAGDRVVLSGTQGYETSDHITITD